MKYRQLLFVAIVVLTETIAAPLDSPDERVNGENGWYVPQINGSFVWVNLDEVETLQKESLIEEVSVSRKRKSLVEFYLYTSKNPTEPQKIEATRESIKNSNFNAKKPTRFTIHGWTGSYLDDINVLIRDAWLSRGQFNIIAVDWSSKAQKINYAQSVKYVPDVGEAVANFIDFLHLQFRMPFDSLMLIGHSLGAHVCGFAGKKVREGRVHTIIGLDPALPLYSWSNSDKRLSDNDAVYVETIHTNAGKLGFVKPIGNCAFYPNGGKSQPGCGLDTTGACSHSRSYIYYAESLEVDKFPSVECSDYNQALKKKCGGQFSPIHMGSVKNPRIKAFGHFYVPVNKRPPYGKEN